MTTGTECQAKELIAAMRPASSHPEDERGEDDLGRFGWGMKSASLSQARVMTVITWCDQGIFAASWDIDDINDWGMEYFEGDEVTALLNPSSQSGTEVRWEKADRLLKDIGGGVFEDALTHLIAQA